MAADATQVEIDLNVPEPKGDELKRSDQTIRLTAKPETVEPEIEVVKEEPKVQTQTEFAHDTTTEVEDGLKKVQRQLEEERVARADAERRANDAARGERDARVDVQDTQKSLLDNAIATLKSKQESAKARYREARIANDADTEFDIQTEIATNAAQLVQLEQGKKALEQQPKPAIRVPQDPVEAFAADLSPRSGSWVRAHPEYVRDQLKHKQMIAAHQLAVAKGHQIDSDEYFSSLEKTLDIADPGRQVVDHGRVDRREESALSEASKPKRSPATAPVSRTGAAPGQRSNVVKLSAEEVEVAKLMGMTEREYAIQKVELQKEGRLN